MPKFTKISQEFREAYKEKFKLTDNAEITKRAEEDPVIFAYYFLGQTMRLHQAYVIHRILTANPKTEDLGPRIAMCIARQIGKSIAFCVFAVWSCWYNKNPATMFNNTNIYITSRDDSAAKDVIKKMKKVLKSGDWKMKEYGEGDNYFSGSLKQPTNAYEITFLNESYVGSFPPTLTSLGKSASWFFIDEAHRLNCTDTDPETFFDVASVIVSETKGGICLSSSAQGITGFFYRAIDPEKQFEEDNEYDSLWWDHTIWDEDTPSCITHKAFVKSEKIRLTNAGRFKMWQQEHGSLFTVTEIAFFDHKDIDNNLEDVPNLYEYDEACATGIDYGLKNARTVITVRAKIKDIIRQIFQWRSPADFDINLLKDPKFEHSIPRLKMRYPKMFMIIADDCPAGDTTNRWIESESGIELKKYNFRSDQMSKTDGINRNCLAYSYRAALKMGKLLIPKWNTTQQFEMKTVQEVEQKVLISIKAPQGQLCDTFDSDMMASLPFLDMQNIRDFQVDSLHGDDEEPGNSSPRVDKSSFKKMTDEQCRQLIADANEGLIGPED